MLQTYSYNKQDEAFNAIVDSVLEHMSQNVEETKSANYAEEVKNINASIMKYCLADTKYASKYEENPLAAAKDPNVRRTAAFMENFNAILAEVINAGLPMISNAKYMDTFAEVVQVGYGDNARFTVESNELWKVNEIANGVQRGVLQPVYNTEYTVDAAPVQIATAINWYQVAAGVADFAMFGIRAAKSFESYIFLKIVAAMSSATNQLGAGYKANGMTNQNWDNLVQRVEAANGGSGVYALGTISALGQVIPSNNYLQFGLGEEIAKNGFLNRYRGISLIPYSNVLKPMTVNTSADLVLPDTDIYFVGAGKDKPVKIVMEGDSVVVEADPNHNGNADRTYGITITYRLGISAIVGSKFGKLTLAA